MLGRLVVGETWVDRVIPLELKSKNPISRLLQPVPFFDTRCKWKGACCGSICFFDKIIIPFLFLFLFLYLAKVAHQGMVMYDIWSLKETNRRSQLRTWKLNHKINNLHKIAKQLVILWSLLCL